MTRRPITPWQPLMLTAALALSLSACGGRDLPVVAVPGTSAGTAATEGGAVPMRTVLTREDAVRAAGFRYLFTNNGSAFQQNVAAYCVGLGQGADVRDPSARLMQELDGQRPVVRAASACTRGVDVKDSATGVRALLFTISDVQCTDAVTCTFGGGYYEGNLSASSGRFSAVYHPDMRSWQITPVGPQVIS